jgi:hypothetical protein
MGVFDLDEYKIDCEQECKDADHENGMERAEMEGAAIVLGAAFAAGGVVGAAKQSIETFDRTIDSLYKPDDSVAETVGTTLLLATITPVLLPAAAVVGFCKGGWSWLRKASKKMAEN